MKIGITSQNFRTITGHAGKSRRFIVFEALANASPQEIDRWDLPREMSMHEYRGSEPHPLGQLDILITGSCGQGFQRRLAGMGVRVIVTGETDPQRAVTLAVAGDELPPPSEDHHHGHDHGHEVTIS